MSKKLIKEEVPYRFSCNISLGSFDGRSLKIMAKLIKETEKGLAEQGYTNVCFDVDYGRYVEDGAELNLIGERLETDEEEKRRIRKTKTQRALRKRTKKNNEEQEFQKYMKLREKYGDIA